MTEDERVRYEFRREMLKLAAIRTGVEYPADTEMWPELRGLMAAERSDVRERVARIHDYGEECRFCKRAATLGGVIITCPFASSVTRGPCPEFEK